MVPSGGRKEPGVWGLKGTEPVGVGHGESELSREARRGRSGLLSPRRGFDLYHKSTGSHRRALGSGLT